MKKTALIFFTLLSIFLFSCSGIPHKIFPFRAVPDYCLPNFPDKDCWYGADAAYSIKLDNERTLWLFGDTFAAPEEGRRDRIGMDVILGATLAISTCAEEGKFNIKYFIKNKNGKFVSFFGENEWLWPQDPFLIDNALYIPLLVIEALPKKYAPFNFRVTGHKIALIKDFTDADPRNWHVDYLDITKHIPPEITAWATTTIVHDGYLYFYPLFKSRDTTGNILARIKTGDLKNRIWEMEYLHQDGKWDKKIDARRVQVIFSEALSELSVRPRYDNNGWMAIYLSPADGGKRLLRREAPRPEGPWSEGKTLIEKIPEMDEQSPLYDKNTFCYAGKEHVQYSRPRRIVATYVCNSLEEDTETSFLRRNLFLYRPVVVNISY
ncbi:MAG TPA: DUF4185 domain-containing protein [Smithellaceae bacterium]|nr:DUF4185 domain-containing protein [Smithellaceae bacterium]HRS89760.1 DUF4185 domain-containing protein [Smithellaceae bacterium]HRV26617.1 DUF4185 domain-containing protein [Smithellaceae bacterium]